MFLIKLGQCFLSSYIFFLIERALLDSNIYRYHVSLLYIPKKETVK